MSLTEQQMDKIEQVFSNLLFYPAIVLHEFFHYLPARIFGCKPKMNVSLDQKAYTEFESCNIKHIKVIGILPTVIGLLAFPLVVPYFSLSPVGVYVLFSWALMTSPSMADVKLIFAK